MGSPFGAATRCAMKLADEDSSTYGGEPSTPTNMVPLRSENITNPPTMDGDDALIGNAGKSESEIVAWDPAGTISTEAWFQGLEYLFASAFGFVNPSAYTGNWPAGSGGSPAPVADGQTYYHVFELDDELEITQWQAGERIASSGSDPDATFWDTSDHKHRDFGIGFDKIEPTNPDVFLGAMVQKMQLNASPGDVFFDWDLICQRKYTDKAFNESNWAMTHQHKANFSGLTFGLGSIGATAPSHLPVTDLTLVLENNLQAGLHESGSDSEYISEPIRENFRKVTGSVKLGRMNSQYSTWLTADDFLQMQIKLIGPIIPSSAIAFTMDFILEKVKLTKAEFPVAGPGVITGDIEFEAFIPPSTHPAWVNTPVGGVDLKKHNEMLLVLGNNRSWSWMRKRHGGSTLP